MISQVVSAAFFCPRTKPPPERYVDELRVFLRQNRYGISLLDHVSTLDSTWRLLAQSREDIASIPDGIDSVKLLADWGRDGSNALVCSAKTSIIALPLLLVLQLGQYLRYLELSGVRHADFLEQVGQCGGIHGYCGGYAAALAIACAENEEEAIQHAAVLLRVVLAIGAAMEAADHQTAQQSTTIAVRLKHEEQGQELIERFPGTYISAVTEPKSVSIVGPSCSLTLLINHAKEIGLPVHVTDITGKSHNPENHDLAWELISLLGQYPQFQLPKHVVPRVLVRSNSTGDVVSTESLMADMITMMLTSRCEWYTLLSLVAEDMRNSDRACHLVAVFGMDNCVPMSPFHKKQVVVSKFEARSLAMVSTAQTPSTNSPRDLLSFSDTAVAIVGASCRLPGAKNMEELWQLVSEGRDCHQELPQDRIDTSGNFRNIQNGTSNQKKTFYGNFIDAKGFDGAFFGVNNRESANMDPQQRLLLELSYEALEDSGYIAQHVREAGDLVGCFVGASFVEYLDNTNAHAPTAYTSTGTIRGFLCGRISHYYGWSGPSEVIDTACSSSLVAINRACKALQLGECTMALAGGVNIITGMNNFIDLGKAQFLSPSGQCKSFDALADGYCRSEGGGFVVLKLLKQAIEAQDNILAVIPSVGTNQGGLSPSLTVPSGHALQSLYKDLLKQANLQPSEVSYVEAHATGTQVGDPIEMESIRAVFGNQQRPSSLPVGSIKGNIGHCETAAGVAGLLKVLAMLRHGKIPGQANYRNLNPNIPVLEPDHLFIPQDVLSWEGRSRVALVNSYGAAGSNAALLCCDAPCDGERSRSPANILLPLIVSADSERSLILQVQALARYLEKLPPGVSFADVTFTLNHRRLIRNFCFSTTARSTETAVNLQPIEPQTFEYTRNPKPVVLVFGGQNGKSVNLSRSWMESYPAFRKYMDTCDRELQRLGHPSLYPAVFSDSELPTAVLVQCGMFAVQYACASCWIDAGLKIGAIVGHSLGEIVALVVSKALTLREGIQLVASRADLVDTKWGADKGSMLAVHASSCEVAGLIDSVQSGLTEAKLEIACYNTPQCTIVAGNSASVELAERTLRENESFAGTKCQHLSTTHAFHSILTEPLLAGIDDLAENISWHEPVLPLEFCSPTALRSIKEWTAAKHLREPVHFSAAVRRIEERLGACIWLEAGLNSPMLSLAKRACSHADMHSFFPLDTRSRETPSDMISDVISGLWKHGISLQHWAFLGQNPKHVWLPPYQFDKQPHWVKNIDRVAEANRQLAQNSASSQMSPEPTVRWLVTRRDSPTSESMLFDIDHQCDRFQKIVAGHAVLGQPLCPASLYMECATMAAGLVKGIEGKANVQFDDMDFLAPLGLGLQQKITLTLEQLESDMAWTFTVESARSDSPLNPSIHCKGKLVLSQTAEFPRWSRFLDGRVKRLKESENAEKILSKRAYGLFSRVVSYFTFLKGIQCIYIDGNEALATIILPKDDQPGRHESTAWQRCDTCLTDVFISTAGLLLNSSGMVPEDQVMIATGVEQVVLGPTCTMDLPVQWTVYAMFTMVSELNALGDIFVYSSQGTMVAAFSGVRFAKVQMFKLRRTLQSINPKSTVSSVAATIDSASATPDAISTIMSTPSTNDSDQEVDVSATTLAGIKDTIRSLIAGFVGLDGSKMPMDALLADLGIDSLSSIELAAEIQTELEVSISSEDVCNMTVAGLCQRVSGSMPEFAAFEAVESMQSCEGFQVGNIHLKKGIQYQIAFDDPFQLLIKAQSRFDMAAKKHGFTNYWDEPHRLQSELLGAYILEAFEELGLNLKSMPPATPVPPLPNIPKHNRLVYRLWTILQAHGIIERQGNVYTTVGGRGNTNFRSSHEIHDIFTARFPQYRSEANVMGLTGPKLASCLLGQQSPIALMFGSQSAAKVMEEYYRNSPMLSVFTDLLVGYVMELCKGVATSLEAPIRILEVGAGTGGTTTKLADALAATGVACQYTFTDISTTLVSQARDRFGKYPWMDFHIFDLEREVETTFRNEYHIVIGTNVVHATRDRVLSCQRLRDTLTDDGILILSEVTRVIDWYDICFGLLDGWWYASNGTEYPLQSSCVWLEALRAAGFPSTGCSRGTSPESTTQQLLVGFKRALQPTVPVAVPHHIDVMEYKEVDGVRIHADVYVPHTVKPAPMPLALLIHGGGHMSLSRKAIRSAQVNHLLANGYLPVSLDYRLCPEINLIDGAMTDVRDGYWWARNKLPLDLLKRGFVVDSDHVVVVGWSTGGHLAMSIAWTTMEVGMPPPARILSFYAPVDFESRELDNGCGMLLPQPSMDITRVLANIPRTPITNHGTNPTDEFHLGFLKEGDVRSELLLHAFKKGLGLPFLLNGLPKGSETDYFSVPSVERIAAISPLAQLRRGNYNVPTYIIHGTRDDIAPFAAAERFIEEMGRQRVEHGILRLDVGHVFDVDVDPGTTTWDEQIAPGYRFLFNST